MSSRTSHATTERRGGIHGGRHTQHVGRACDGCRGRKYKCDGDKPLCGPCAQRHLECKWTAQVDQRRALTKEQLVEVNRRIAQLEDQQRDTALENARLSAENEYLKVQCREHGVNIVLPDFSSVESAAASSPTSSLPSVFFPSPAVPTTSLPSTSSDNNLLSVDFRPRSSSSSYPAGHAAQNRARRKSDPYSLHPHANPAFVGKGVAIPGRGTGAGNVDFDANHNDGSGFIAHTRTHSAPDMRTHLPPALQITTANDDGLTASGYSSYGYDTPSPASSVSAYDLPPQSPYPTTPNSPFLSAPASPYIQNHGPAMPSSVFDPPSSPVKNSMVFNHPPFKSEIDLHPSPFLPTFAGSSNSSPSLYDHHNFTFTPNTNDSMLLGMSGSLIGAEERDEMKVEI